MQKRFVIFLMLSAAIFLAWQLAIEKFYPKPPGNPRTESARLETSQPSPPAQADGGGTDATAQSGTAVAAGSQSSASPATSVEQRQIKVRTDFWEGVVSNKGGVLTQWTMTRFTDGKPIDAPNGVSLVSEKLGQFGFPFRLAIPADRE